MSKISKSTERSLWKFCRRLAVDYIKSKPKLGGAEYVGIVPDDIEIDRSKGEYFILYGDFYWLFHDVLRKLRRERTLEYLEDRSLKEQLWHLVCEIIAHYEIYRDPKKLNEKLSKFLSQILKPLIDYEVLVPIVNLDGSSLEINIGNTTIKKFDEVTLKNWGVNVDDPAIRRLSGNHTFVVIKEKGNNLDLICQRARKKAMFIIRVLQTSLSTNIFLHPEQMLYEEGKLVFIKEAGDIKASWKWERGYQPMILKLDNELEKNIDTFCKHISEILDEGLPPKLLERFIIAINWIGRAIEEPDNDLKVTYLSTALESILTLPSDIKKGETLAYRMLLLNFHLDKLFVHPAQVLWIYELRSKIVHGSTLEIASKQEYSTMKRVVIETLIHSLEFIRREGLTTQSTFIACLETEEAIGKILGWLDNQRDERSKIIRNHVEDQCIGGKIE